MGVATEILDLNDPGGFSCSLNFDKVTDFGLIGFFQSNGNPIFCLGPNSNHGCYLLQNNSGKWSKQLNLFSQMRSWSSLVQLDPSTWWIVGGRSAHNSPLDSSEMVSDTLDIESGPELPMSLQLPCLVKLNATDIF